MLAVARLYLLSFCFLPPLLTQDAAKRVPLPSASTSYRDAQAVQQLKRDAMRRQLQKAGLFVIISDGASSKNQSKLAILVAYLLDGAPVMRVLAMAEERDKSAVGQAETLEAELQAAGVSLLGLVASVGDSAAVNPATAAVLTLRKEATIKQGLDQGWLEECGDLVQRIATRPADSEQGALWDRTPSSSFPRGVLFLNDLPHACNNAEADILRKGCGTWVAGRLRPCSNLAEEMQGLAEFNMAGLDERARAAAAAAPAAAASAAPEAAAAAEPGSSDDGGGAACAVDAEEEDFDEEVEDDAAFSPEVVEAALAAALDGADLDCDGLEDAGADNVFAAVFPHLCGAGGAPLTANGRSGLLCFGRLFGRSKAMRDVVNELRKEGAPAMRTMPADIGHRLRILPTLAAILTKQWDLIFEALVNYAHALSGKRKFLAGGTCKQLRDHIVDLLSYMNDPAFRLCAALMAELEGPSNRAYTLFNQEQGFQLHLTVALIEQTIEDYAAMARALADPQSDVHKRCVLPALVYFAAARGPEQGCLPVEALVEHCVANFAAGIDAHG